MKNLAAAMIKAQKEMAPLLKDTKGNFGKYATLASVQDVCLGALGNAGIAVFQTVHTDWDDGRVYVRVGCTLCHAESGETLMDELSLVPAKTDPQGIGSAITYGRRYVLMAVAGIAPEDDDGQLASTGTVQAPSKQNVQRPQQPPQAPPKPAVTPNSNTLPIDKAAEVTIESWKEPKDAMGWATRNNYTQNEHSARTRFEQIVKDDFGGSCTKTNLKDVFRAYATHYLSKPVEPIKETA